MCHLQRMMDASLDAECAENYYSSNLTRRIEKSLQKKFYKTFNVLAVVIAVAICFSVASPVTKKMHNALVAFNGWDITVNEELRTIEVRK